MAHYAFIDENNIVQEVSVGLDENNTSDLPEGFSSWEDYYTTKREGLTCLRTSYNTYDNVHYNPETGEPSADQTKAFRGNYAAIGGTYDATNDIFIQPKPHPSWVWDSSIGNLGGWKAPVDEPTYSPETQGLLWNEETTSWDIYEFNTDLEIWELVE